MPLALENDLRAALDADDAGNGARATNGRRGRDVDPETRGKIAAFLLLNRERIALQVNLDRIAGSRSDRFLDLTLITELARLEFAHLGGLIARASSPRPDVPATEAVDPPAAWAQPWGVRAMMELRMPFADFEERRARLAKHLSPAVRARTYSAAERWLRELADRLDARDGHLAHAIRRRPLSNDPPEGRRRPRALLALGRVRRAVPTSLPADRRFLSAAAIGAGTCLAIGLGALAIAGGGGGGSAGSAIAPAASAKSPDRPLAKLGDGSPSSKAPRHKAKDHKPEKTKSKPEPKPKPEPTPATPTPSGGGGHSAPAPAPPVTTTPVAPAPVAPAPAPAPTPAPAPSGSSGSSGSGGSSGPGPVHNLPPPVNNLPGPGGSALPGG
jgi:hypothetical protein